MLDYLQFFFEDPRQIISFGAVIIVWSGLIGLGSIFSRDNEDVALYPILGWGCVTLVFTFVGTLTKIPFTYIALALALIAAGFSCYLIWRKQRLIDPVFWRMIIWGTPLFLLVSAMLGSQWDEFSHWLHGQKYFLQHDQFPGKGRPLSAASFPAYPYAWQLLAYFAGRITGSIVENAASFFNILLLFTLARLAVGHALKLTGDQSIISRSPWLIASLAAAVASIFNPTFVQKVVLTAYADTATSVTLAVGVLIGWSMLEALAVSDIKRARRRALMAGLAFAILISLKQSTLELFGLGLGALFFVGLVDSRIRLLALLQCITIAATPGILAYGGWRHYVANELQGREFVIKPFEMWQTELIPSILYKMGYVLLKKSAYLAAMLIAIVFGVRGLIIGSTEYSRAMLTIGLVFLGHTVFLAFCYVAVFHGHEAKTIASYWRYNQQLGGLAMLVVGLSGSMLIARYRAQFSISRLKWLPAILVLLAPMIFAHKIRFDKKPAYGHYRLVGVDVASRIEPNAGVRVLDPKGSGESGLMLRYEISDVTHNFGYQAAFHDISAEALSKYWQSIRTEYVVIHSVTPAIQSVFGDNFKDGNSYLIQKTETGSPNILATWAWPQID